MPMLIAPEALQRDAVTSAVSCGGVGALAATLAPRALFAFVCSIRGRRASNPYQR